MDDQLLFHPDWKKPMTRKRWEAQKAANKKRVYKRTGSYIACEFCGRDVYVTSSISLKRKYCSKACSNKARPAKKPPRNCSVCHRPMTIPEPGLYKYRKTCSKACQTEAAKRSKYGPQNVLYMNGQAEKRRLWQESKSRICRACGGTDRLRLHHVVYEQQVRRAKGEIWDPRNSMTLCMQCHHGHHGAGDRRIHISMLDEENLEFAAELLLGFSFDYIVRRYDGTFQEVAVAIRPYLERLGVADSIARYFPPEPAEVEW